MTEKRSVKRRTVCYYRASYALGIIDHQLETRINGLRDASPHGMLNFIYFVTLPSQAQLFKEDCTMMILIPSSAALWSNPSMS